MCPRLMACGVGFVVLLAGPLAPARAQEPAPSGDSGQGAVLSSAVWTVFPVTAGIVMAAGGGGAGRTAISASLMWGGVIAGPSAGYVMHDRGRRAVPGVVLRAGVFALAWAVAPTESFDDGFLPNPPLDDLGPWLVAVPIIAISAVVDVVMAGRRIRAAPARVQVLPVRPRSGGIGLTVAAPFPRR